MSAVINVYDVANTAVQVVKASGLNSNIMIINKGSQNLFLAYSQSDCVVNGSHACTVAPDQVYRIEYDAAAEVWMIADSGVAQRVEVVIQQLPAQGTRA